MSIEEPDGDAEPPKYTIFKDRRDAGKQLARMLVKYRDQDAVVLALPRGGVPVGLEVALALDAPLDIFVVRKLGVPGQPELGMGAVAPGGIVVLDKETISALHVTSEEVEETLNQERAEMERRLSRFRGGKEMVELRDRTVILVDDGLATGITAYAAICAVRIYQPRKIVLAAPVAALQTARTLAREVDELVSVKTPEKFIAVGIWYDDFEQTTDEEVLSLIAESQLRLL